MRSFRGLRSARTHPCLLVVVIHDNPTPVELDFSAVPYVSSAGLRILALAAKASRQRLTQPTALVLSLLKLTNFTALIDVSA